MKCNNLIVFLGIITANVMAMSVCVGSHITLQVRTKLKIRETRAHSANCA
jgi:hypothetical protein